MKTTLNFGALRDTITKKANIEMMNENSNSTLISFMEAVKKSPILKKQYLIYKNFEKTKPFKNERLAERFIAQNINVMKDVSWEQLQKENAQLRQALLGGPDECTVIAKKDSEALYENLSTVLEASINKNFKRPEKEVEAYESLMEHLTRTLPDEEMNKEEERPDTSRFWKFITQSALSHFNERYEALDEDERELFRVLIAEGPNKKTEMLKMRRDLTEMVEGKMKEAKAKEDVVILETFKSKLMKEVADEMLMSDEYAISCFELKKALSER